MHAHEEAALGVAPEARPEIERQPDESSAPPPPAQARPVRLWRFFAWPRKFGVRCSNTNERVLSALERILGGGDYARLIALDGRALVIVEGGYFEALRRAAYGHAPPLDALDLDDIRAAEDAAWGGAP